MRKYLSCILLAATLLALSCSSGGGGGGGGTSATVPDFTNDNFLDKYDSILSIQSDGIFITVKGDPDLEIEINGEAVDLEEEEEAEEGDDFTYYYGDFANIDIAPGEVVSYRVEIDGSVHKGSIKMPDDVECDYEMDDDDIQVSWTTSTSPSAWLLYYFWETDDEDFDDRVVQLKGSARKHTIDTDELPDQLGWFGLILEAINVKTHGKSNLVLSLGFSDVYDDGYKMTAPSDRMLLFKRLLKQFHWEKL